ncbi:hypothetical protein [Pelagibacterium mangrovi]|uniref:hypothetical protein n=1 Tax=Pelagibacterium mangrovi TaxID=3119828 RepID=UPI002FC79813
MNRLSGLALSSILALSLPFAAQAQDAGATPENETSAEDANADAGDTETGAFTYDDLNAALQGMADADLEAVTADTEIEIVPLSSLDDETAAQNADEYTTGVTDETGDMSDIRAAIEANTHISAALEAQGYTAEDVAALWVQGDGALTIFVDDTESDAQSDSEAPAEGAAAPQ